MNLDGSMPSQHQRRTDTRQQKSRRRDVSGRPRRRWWIWVINIWLYSGPVGLVALLLISGLVRDRKSDEPHRPASAVELHIAQGAYEKWHDELAVTILRPLAEGGDAEAQYMLAQIYEEGRAKHRNLCEATRFYDRAARQGHIRAQTKLAVAYQLGNGVMRDREIAYRWASAASKSADAVAIQIRDEIAADLSPVARSRLDSEMTTWRPEDQPPAWIIFIPGIAFVTGMIEGMADIFIGVEPCYEVP